MANQPTRTKPAARANIGLPILVPTVLIAQFLWNVLTTAHEYPMRSEQIMTMAFDFLMVVGLFAYRQAMPKPLFWSALVAGIGLFALRLGGDDGWWTGHLFYSLY